MNRLNVRKYISMPKDGNAEVYCRFRGQKIVKDYLSAAKTAEVEHIDILRSYMVSAILERDNGRKD